MTISICHRVPDQINIQGKSATNIVFNLGPLILLLLYTVKLFGLKIKIKIIPETCGMYDNTVCMSPVFVR